MEGLFVAFIGFVLLRGFLRSSGQPWWHRFGQTARTLLCNVETALQWGLLVVGLFLTFSDSVRIGLVALGSFMVLYKTSVSQVQWKRIPLLDNSLALFGGLVLLLTGLVLSFVLSARLGVFVLVGCFVAGLAVRILMRLEIAIMRRNVTE